MRKKMFVFLTFLLLAITPLAHGQGLSTDEVSGVGVAEEKVFHPVIVSDDSMAVGKKKLFSVDLSALPEGVSVKRFFWEFGDRAVGSQEEEVHAFREPGRYTVRMQATLSFADGRPDEVREASREVFVYERSLFLITDTSQSAERIEALERSAEDQNVYLNVTRSAISLRLKSQFLKQIEVKIDDIQASDTVIIWSESLDLLTVLSRFAQQLNFQQKDIVIVTDGNINFIENIVYGMYSTLEPKRLIITRREAIDEFFSLQEDEDAVQVIQSRGYDLNVLSPATDRGVDFWSLPSRGISYLQQKGVDDSVLLAVLFLPVIVTLVTFLKLIIGLSSAGARVPIIFAYTLLVLGAKFGVLVIVILALITHFFRLFLFRSHLLYTAKVGVLTSFLGLVTLFIIGGAMLAGFPSFEFSSALMIIILAAIIDRIAGVEGERGVWSLVRLFIETLLIALVCFIFISWTAFEILLMAHPEVILLFIVANVFMGRFTGLRLLEYFRFREIVRYTEE